MKAVAHTAVFAEAARDECVDERGDLRYGSAVDPVVGPEATSVTRAKLTACEGTEDGVRVGVMRYREVAPWPRGVRALEP